VNVSYRDSVTVELKAEIRCCGMFIGR